MTLKEKENSVLNLYMDFPDLFDGLENFVFKEVWGTALNQNKYEIIKSYHAKKVSPDSLLIKSALEKLGYKAKEILEQYGEPDYRIKQNIQEYVKEIFDEWCRKVLKSTLHTVHSELSSSASDLEHNIDLIKSDINTIESIKNNVKTGKSAADVHKSALEELKLKMNSADTISGYSTSLKELDKITNGLKQEVIVIGAPPGSGKSSLMVQLINEVGIKQKDPVIVFSLEMPEQELVRNMWANYFMVNSNNIRTGNISAETFAEIEKFENNLGDNVVIDSTPGITAQYIQTVVRRTRAKLKLPLDKVIVVMIDYLQLMKNIPEETKGISSEEQMSIRCNNLLEIAKNENLCMIELSQFSRGLTNYDRTSNKMIARRPTLADFKGSGAIEANAVQCWLLYRPDYYEENPTEQLDNGQTINLRGLCEINVAKNRYGPTGKVFVEFLRKYSKFKDYKLNKEDDIQNNNFTGDEF